MLYSLLHQGGDVVRYYLLRIVFPEVTAHQATKLCSNGQDLGGEMLFGTRIGFSGTPSSLLPLEMGDCVYQEGDDAKMLRTLTDPAIVSRHKLESSWSVESLLMAVTRLDPCPHALIDAGALVTGFTNAEVAQRLLDGLPHDLFDGVVYLIQGGTKRILLRGSVEPLELERCGVPKERRFSFYDQVHTTGTDIPQPATAHAVLTLSADLIFRDYAQAAYRMRGIGKGQRIVLFVIPEVQKLLDGEACRGRNIDVAARASQIAALPSADAQQRAALDDVIAWLLLNSFRTERVQFELWCLHCAQNVWRKSALSHLRLEHAALGEPAKATKKTTSPDEAKRHDGDRAPKTAKGELTPAQLAVRTHLEIFRERVDHAVSNSTPEHTSTCKQIMVAMEAAGGKPEGSGGADIDRVLALLAGHEPGAATDADAATAAPARRPSAVDDGSRGGAAEVNGLGQEQEQQQEQEEEQEKEQQQQQQKEQEQEAEEPEVYVREKYGREDESPKAWALSALGKQPVESGHTFFPAADFATHRTLLDKRGPLRWPENLLFSANHTQPRWRFSNHRRLKNLLILMEWMPDAHDRLMGKPAVAAKRKSIRQIEKERREQSKEVAAPDALTAEQRERLERLVSLYDANDGARGTLSEASLRRVLFDLGLRADDDARDGELVERLLRDVGAAGGGGVLGADGSLTIPAESFCELMGKQTFLRGEAGRYWVALSLREAESLRGCLHQATDEGHGLIVGSSAAVGLRLPDSTLVDALGPEPSTIEYSPPLQLQLQTALAAFRFIDSRFSYEPEEIRVLLRVLRADAPADRRRWFAEVCSCRRRPQGLLQRKHTPLESVLTANDEYPLLLASAARWRLAEEMNARRFGAADLYHAINSRQDGLMTCSELAAGLEWLGAMKVSGGAETEDVHALARSIDLDGDGLISIAEWMEAFPGILESDPTTQLQLATLVLTPKNIPEIHQGADGIHRAIPVRVTLPCCSLSLARAAHLPPVAHCTRRVRPTVGNPHTVPRAVPL